MTSSTLYFLTFFCVSSRSQFHYRFSSVLPTILKFDISSICSLHLLPFHAFFVQFFGSTTFLARPHAFLPAALTFEKASVLAVCFHSNGRGRRNEIKTSFLLRYKASDQALS